MNGKEVLKNKVNVVLAEEEAVPNESVSSFFYACF